MSLKDLERQLSDDIEDPTNGPWFESEALRLGASLDVYPYGHNGRRADVSFKGRYLFTIMVVGRGVIRVYPDVDEEDAEPPEVSLAKEALRGERSVPGVDISALIKNAEAWRLITNVKASKGNRKPIVTATNLKGERIVWDGEVFDDVESFFQRVLSEGSADEYVNMDWMESEYNYSDFWGSPGPLFHATSEDALSSIRRKGLEARSDTRGLTNKGTPAAVFTSLDPTGYIESYGNVVLRIDTAAMKRDGYTPPVSGEYPLVEYEVLKALQHLLGIEEDDFIDSPGDDLDPSTVIVYGSIPPKYLSLVA